jgi:hypothetical protein
MARAKKAAAPVLAPLDAMLTLLKLTGIRDQLDSLLDEAGRANVSARETLALLCEREIARKDHRRIDMALKLAHFPVVKDLAGFDFEAQPSVDPKQMRDLAQGRWIANGENLLLLGPPGVGKTHLAIALGGRARMALHAAGVKRSTAKAYFGAICSQKAPRKALVRRRRAAAAVCRRRAAVSAERPERWATSPSRPTMRSTRAKL